MVRGATAQFRFQLPYPKGEFTWVTIKFWQPNNVGTATLPLPITKTLEHCEKSNIYKCVLENELSASKQYYFFIDDKHFAFTGEDIPSGMTLVFNTQTKTITHSNGVINVDNTTDTTSMEKVEFVNETDLMNELCVTLDPAETIRFSDRIKARVQMRAQHISGKVIPTRMEYITVYPMNKELAEDNFGGGGTTNEDGWIILDGETIA
jgi:hypothetical protein